MIGVFGGTFDPIHYGHLRSALEVQQLFQLRELRLIPCANPPHRQQPMTPASMRAEMVALAIANSPNLRCDNQELQRVGNSYTVDTLKALRAELGEESLVLFIGNDAFAQLPRWHCWQRLFDYAHIVVLTRPDSAAVIDFGEQQAFFSQRQVQMCSELSKKPAGLLLFQAVTALAISATAIRQQIASGRSPQFLLSDAVLDYITQHQLYQTDCLGTSCNK
jgi:nicotinate-nucleotide adenylyltransferase